MRRVKGVDSKQQYFAEEPIEPRVVPHFALSDEKESPMLSHFTSQSFRAGDPVPQRGHYVALHPSGAASYGQILFEAGEPFPLCSRCDNVRYQLVRSAGNILQIDQAGRNSKGQL